ncbi:MAG: hypothetical protein WCA17_08565 [Burkholderiales bacterium]
MLLHLLGAEQLGSERRFFVRVNAWQAVCAKLRIQPSQVSDELGASAQFEGVRSGLRGWTMPRDMLSTEASTIEEAASIY